MDGRDSLGLASRYLHGPAIDQILADEQITTPGSPGEVLWPLADHLGSVRDLAVFDDQPSQTTIASHIVYDAFGQIVEETNPAVKHHFGFTGRERDPETGNYYDRARYYDAAIGKFLKEDPIGFTANDPNLFRYVGNEPTTSIDPDGLDRIEAVWKSDRQHFDLYYVNEPTRWSLGVGHLWRLVAGESKRVYVGAIDNESGHVRLPNGRWSTVKQVKDEAGEYTNWKSFSEDTTKTWPKNPDEMRAEDVRDGRMAGELVARENLMSDLAQDDPGMQAALDQQGVGNPDRIVDAFGDIRGLTRELMLFYFTAPLELAQTRRVVQSLRNVDVVKYAPPPVAIGRAGERFFEAIRLHPRLKRFLDVRPTAQTAQRLERFAKKVGIRYRFDPLVRTPRTLEKTGEVVFPTSMGRSLKEIPLVHIVDEFGHAYSLKKGIQTFGRPNTPAYLRNHAEFFGRASTLKYLLTPEEADIMHCLEIAVRGSIKK